MQGHAFSFRRKERGNALFLILVAVALFAALSYVVMQGGKPAGGLTEKDDQMAAFARLTQFPEAVRTTVDKMLLTGTDISELNFDRNAEGKGAVFQNTRYQNPPLSIGTTADWGFKTHPADGTGWFVAGIGTDEKDGKDVFAYLEGLDQPACEQIKKALGLAASPLTEATTVNLEGKGGSAEDGAGNNDFTFNAHNAAVPPDPQPATCVRNGFKADKTPNYIYYHVIVAK